MLLDGLYLKLFARDKIHLIGHSLLIAFFLPLCDVPFGILSNERQIRLDEFVYLSVSLLT